MNEPLVLRDARFVLTMDGPRILERADIRIENGVIRDVGNVEVQRGDEVRDCSGSIVMPGLVNSHTHAAMTILRGLNDDAPLDEWLRSMWEVEAKMTPGQERMGAEMGFMEMVRTGTTACLDMFGAAEGARAADRVGLRIANGPPLISIFGNSDERLSRAKEYIEEHGKSERVIPVVNLHSIYTNDEDTVRRAAELSKKENVLLNVHCSETRKEVFENRRDRGRLAVEELDHSGALWERTVLVHLGWASSWEFGRIRDKGAMTVHCPNSNLKLGTGGFFPYRELAKMGITVGLGTDSAASNNSLDMFREMRSMALVQKGQYWDPTAASALDVLHCAISGGNRILGLRGGMIKRGCSADICVLDISPGIGPLRSDNLASALVYSAVGENVGMTIVSGEIVYENGALRDGAALSERYQELSETINREIFY
ncbi:MAG: amidohydrolase [Thermoplasmatota archaeon]